LFNTIYDFTQLADAFGRPARGHVCLHVVLITVPSDFTFLA